MRALVTGCAGFIGSHLVESLLADGWSVVGVDSFLDNYEASEKRLNLQAASEWEEFELHEADLADAALHRFVDGCDVIFHLAAEPGVRDSWGQRFESYVRNNVLATQRLLEAAKQEPAARFVYGSSSSIYGQAELLPTPESTLPRPFSPYGVTKLAAEHLCQLYYGNYGIPAVILRFFSVYGPRQRPDMAAERIATALARGGRFEVYGNGEQSRDVTYVDDAVTATIAVMEAGRTGSLYNVGGGSETSLREMIELCQKISGRELDVHYGAAATGDVRRTAADCSAIRADVGWLPQTSLEDGLTSQLAWAASPSTPVI